MSFTNVADTTTSSSSSQVRVIDSQGKTIMTLYNFNTNAVVKQWTYNEASNTNYNLNVADLKKGIYVLQVDREGHTKTTKIIIE